MPAFKGLGPKERVVTLIKGHWIQLPFPYTVYLLGWVFLLILFMMGQVLDEILFFELSFKFAAAVILVGIHHWLFIYLFHRDGSDWIITNRHVLGFRYLPFFRHDVIMVVIRDIREIEDKKHGFWQNLLDYGRIEITLAAGPDLVTIDTVGQPDKMVKLLDAIHKIQDKEEALDYAPVIAKELGMKYTP